MITYEVTVVLTANTGLGPAEVRWNSGDGYEAINFFIRVSNIK